MFKALKYTKILEDVGLTREQAEAHIEIMTEVMDSNLATKQDVKDLRQEVKELEVSLLHEIKDVRNDIVQSEYRLTVKMGTIVSVALGIAIAFLKFVH